MTPEQAEQVSRLFLQMVELPPPQHPAFLAKCGADEGVRAEVAALLARDGGRVDWDAEPRPDARQLLQAAAATPAYECLEPGHVLGPYRLVRVIGRGGMGLVFAAEDESFPGKRRVALKVLAPDPRRPAEATERFLREAAAAARLEHPDVVKVHAAAVVDGFPVIAMELVEGPSLQDVLRWRRGGCSGPTDAHGRAIPGADAWRTNPIEPACRLVARLARALHALHERGVLHRDVKPSNVLLRLDGAPVLTDFGLARTESATTLTRSGEFMGTPYYVAPEQARGRRHEVDARADVYAIGATLFELLTLRVPFDGDTNLEVLQRVVSDEPAPLLRRFDDTIGRDLETVCLTALEKRRERRYPTAAALADDLERFLSYRPVLARPVGVMGRTLRWARRNRGAAAALGLVVLLVLGAAVATGSVLHYRGVAVEESRRAADETRRAAAETSFVTAQASAKRGAWREALSYYDRALEFGYHDDVAVAVGKIEAWHGLVENGAALQELTRLSPRPDLGQHRAKVVLLHGIVGHDRFANPDAGRDEIAAALDLHDRGESMLAAADAAFARAYLANDLAGTKAHLVEAVRLDPAHHGAVSSLAWIFLLLGEHDASREMLSAYRALAPENPAGIGLQALVLAGDGALDAARAVIAGHEELLGPSLASGLTLGVDALAFARSLDHQMLATWGRKQVALTDQILNLVDVLPWLRRIQDLMAQQTTEAGVQLALPPSAAHALRGTAAFFFRLLVPGRMPDDLEDDLDEIIDLAPLGPFLMARGALRYASGRPADAALAFRMAASAPGLAPVTRYCVLGQIVCRLAQEDGAGSVPPRAELDAVILRAVELGSFPAHVWAFVHEAAGRIGPRRGVDVATVWLHEHPDDAAALAALKADLQAADAR